MENNNPPRFRTGDGVNMFMQNLERGISNTCQEYAADGYAYQNASAYPYMPSYQTPYRHNLQGSYEVQQIYNEYHYDPNAPQYAYNDQQHLVHHYHENYQPTMDHMSITMNYDYTENVKHSYLSYNINNFRHQQSFRDPTPSYYQDVYANVPQAVHSYGSAPGPSVQEISPNYYMPHAQHSVPHLPFLHNNARPTPTRHELQPTNSLSDSLKAAVIKTVSKTKPGSSPSSSVASKSGEGKDGHKLPGMNFKIYTRGQSKTPQSGGLGSRGLPKTSQVVAGGLQMNYRDFPSLCDNASTSEGIPVDVLFGQKTPLSEETGYKKRSISTSLTTGNKYPRPSLIMPDVGQFLTSCPPEAPLMPPYSKFELEDVLDSIPQQRRLKNNDQVDLSRAISSISLDPHSTITGAKVTEIDYPVPYEYLIYQGIKEKITKVNCRLFTDDLLLYIYYNGDDDSLKLSAIAHLHSRMLKYHQGNRNWVKLPQGYKPGDPYSYFDPIKWEFVPCDKHLDLKQFEEYSYEKYTDYEASVIIVQNSLASASSKRSDSTDGKTHAEVIVSN